MDIIHFRENLKKFAEKCAARQKIIDCGAGEDEKRERETERLLVEPFIDEILDYDTRSFDLRTQYAVSSGKYQYKIDFVLLKEEKPIIAIECKPSGCRLRDHERGQLATYFQMLKADGDTLTVGILTNGTLYEFYIDLEKDNVMDKEPFLCFDLGDIDAIEDSAIKWLMLLRKDSFDRGKFVHELKKENSVLKFKKRIETLLREPTESFMSCLLKEEGFSGGKKEVRQYTSAIEDACKVFLRGVSQKSQEIEKSVMAEEVSAPDPDKEVPRRTRRTFSSLKDMAEKGKISSDIVIMDKEGLWKAVITREGKIRTDDGKTWSSLSDLKDVLTDHKYKGSAWDFWYTEYKGQLVSLFEWRADLESVAE